MFAHVSAHNYHTSFFVLATSDYECINSLVGKFSIFGWGHSWRLHYFLIACCLQSDLGVVKVTAKTKISFCLRRNVLTTNSLLERLFSGVDRFES